MGVTLSLQEATTWLANQSDCPSWPGGVTAAKPQAGWWIKPENKHDLFDWKRF
jgi:hypothetical protein